jgi:hypothetical protein
MAHSLLIDKETNIVENVIEVDPQNIPFFDGKLIIVTDEGGIGWTWDGEKAVEPPPPPPSPPAPQPTLAELQAQLADLTAKIQSLSQT